MVLLYCCLVVVVCGTCVVFVFRILCFGVVGCWIAVSVVCFNSVG